MLVLCVTSWQAYEREWNALYLWDYLDFISRLDVFVLAVILVYIAIVFSRDSYRYREACRELHADVRALAVDLNRGVRTLQSITLTAPYLGLAGTCFGILESWRSLAKYSAAGLPLFPKYPLRRQFSKVPAFALLATPSLAVALAAFKSFSSFRGPVGLKIRLPNTGNPETGDDLLVQPVVIGISDRGAPVEPEIHLNSKKDNVGRLGRFGWQQSQESAKADGVCRGRRGYTVGPTWQS